LSLWERFRGVGKNYNPDLDYKQKIEEMRGEWERQQEERVAEKNAGHEGHDDTDENNNAWSSGVSSYFQRTSAKSTKGLTEKDSQSDDSEPQPKEVPL